MSHCSGGITEFAAANVKVTARNPAEVVEAEKERNRNEICRGEHFPSTFFTRVTANVSSALP